MHPQYTPSDVSRFWSKVHRTGNPDECWEWTACRHVRGYGQVAWLGVCGKTHRIAYELTFGPIPEGKCILHRCDNPACCNPRHLFAGTQLDNIRDRHSKGRTSHASRNIGERSGRSKLTESQVVEILRRHATLGETERSLAVEYGVTVSAIHLVVTRQNWRHVSFPNDIGQVDG